MKKLKIIVIGFGVLLVGCGNGERVNLEERVDSEKNTTESSKEVVDLEVKSKIKDLGDYFTKEDDGIYYKDPRGDLQLEGIDINTFEVIAGRLAKDKNNLYFGLKKLSYLAKEADWANRIDVDSFELLGDGNSEIGYMKDMGSIYYIDCYGMGDCNFRLDRIEADSPENFRLLLDKFTGGSLKNYATDNQNIYKRGELLEDLDARSFEILNDFYLKDKNNIYYDACRGQCFSHVYVLQDADVESFEVLNNGYCDNCYAKDKNNIYFSIHALENVDYDSFEVINERYARDKDYVYDGDKKLEFVDVESFEVLVYEGDNRYLKDKNNIYWQKYSTGNLLILEDVDVESFEVLNEQYTKDKNNVRCFGDNYSGYILEESDPATFEILQGNFAKDKNNYYFHCRKLKNVDQSTFEVLSDQYAKDKNNAYIQICSGGCELEKIKQADLETFELLESTLLQLYSYSKDKNNCYKLDYIVDMSECEELEK